MTNVEKSDWRARAMRRQFNSPRHIEKMRVIHAGALLQEKLNRLPRTRSFYLVIEEK